MPLIKTKEVIKKAIYIIGLVLCACSSETVEETPSGILEKEELIPLIVDLQVLESHFQRTFGRVDVIRNALDSSSVEVFEEHGTTKIAFENSLDYYSTFPDTLYTIYEAALDTINYRLNAVNRQ